MPQRELVAMEIPRIDVPSRTAQEAIELVEAILLDDACSICQVPLADDRSPIAPLLQELGDGELVEVHEAVVPLAVIQHPRHARASAVAACE